MRSWLARTAAMMIALVIATGCDSVAAPFGGVSEPLTPEQARDQALDAARDLVSTLDLPVAKAHFSRAACRDNGGGPYRGKVVISYPKADSYDAATADIEQMVQRLFAAGWDGDTDFRSHSRVAQKDGVVAVFRPQSDTEYRMIDVLGECRDTTTTWETRGGLEPLTLP